MRYHLLAIPDAKGTNMAAEKISPEKITALSETMLIPLWAKAVEYSHPNPILRDAEAVRMMQMIDYDFSKYEGAFASQPGCCARARVLDDMVGEFIAKHPDAVVVQIGAGLDARYERLGKPAVTAWYDLDLPEVLEVRRLLLPENGNRYIAASLFEESWMDTVAAHGKPVLLVIEGVLMYFAPDDLRGWFDTLKRKLPQAQLVFDAIPPIMQKQSKRHDALKNMDAPPEFKWSIAGPEDLAHFGLEVLKYRGLAEICGKRYPWQLRLLYATAWGRRKFDMRVVWVRFLGADTAHA